MTLKSLLEKITKKLKFHNSRSETFQGMVLSLIDQGNVQHHALSKMMPEGSLKSKLERIRRFLKAQEIDQICFGKAVISTLWQATPQMHLILDRTNWKFGTRDINYLVLAVRIRETVFPLFWSMIDHQGNSDAKTRIDLLNQFKEAFGFDRILSFSADREFIGKEWISYLLNHKVPFYIRIKDNQMANFGKTKKPLKDFFSHLNQEETRCLYGMMHDPRIFVVGKKIKNEFLVICSNVQDQNKVLRFYKKRWNIERLFLNMKTNGFNLENTHMKKLTRLSKLMAIVALAIVLSSIVGILVKCAYKKTLQAPLYACFTRGLRYLKTQLLLFDFTNLLKIIQKSEG